MESYIQISQLNDFIFCPRSIFFHQRYSQYEDFVYKGYCQYAGTNAHKAVDTQKYSTRKNVLQGLPVFSEKYGLIGKIDTFDCGKGELVERKRKIKKIYDGYRYQLFAQYFCLKEMGYKVKKLAFYSIVDNKKYPVEIPNAKEIKELEAVVDKMRLFDLHDVSFEPNSKKCERCIYSELCDYKLTK